MKFTLIWVVQTQISIVQSHENHADISETSAKLHGFLHIFGPGIYLDMKTVQANAWIYPCICMDRDKQNYLQWNQMDKNEVLVILKFPFRINNT